MDDKIQALLALYKGEKGILDQMEYTRAPSGEYTDYNHHIIVQEAVVETLESVLEILGVEYE